MRFILPGLVLAFTVYCVVDVVRSESSDVRGLPKTLWVMLVLLFPLAGGAAWFLAGRPKNRALRPQAGRTRPAPRVTGPDDDPDFLRSIRRPRPIDPPAPLDQPSASPSGPADPEPPATDGTSVPSGEDRSDDPSSDRSGDGPTDETSADDHEAADDQDSSDRDDRTP